MLAPGTLLDGRYLLEEVLGVGSAAAVYQAQDQKLGRAVAVKVLEGGALLGDPLRFLEEARTLAALKHESIVAVWDQGVHEGRPYLVLELVTGGSYLDRVRAGPVPRAEIAEVARRVLDALAFAHARDVLHRDVKPENILRTEEGLPKLADFGLAKAGDSQIRTHSGLILGTPHYMAPEVLGGKVATAGADVYSWACSVIHLLQGRPPHEGDISEMLVAKRTARWRAPEDLGPLGHVLERALEPDPTRRPGAGDLLAMLAGERSPGGGARAQSIPSAAPLQPGLGAPPGSWATWALRAGGLLGLTGAALFLVLGRPSPASLSPPPVPPAPRRPPQVLVRWRDLRQGLDPVAWIEQHYGAVDLDRRSGIFSALEPNFYPGTFLQARRGLAYPEVLQGLRAAAPSLPLLSWLEADREALRTAWLSEATTPEERLELYGLLRAFTYVDAYFENWGVPGPYQSAALLAPLVERVTLDLEAGAGDGAVRIPAAAWSDDVDRRFPWIYRQGEDAGVWEGYGIERNREESGGAFDAGKHAFLAGTAEVPEEVLAGARSLAVEMLVGHFYSGTMLRLTVNDWVVDVPSDPKRATHDVRMDDLFPDHRLRLYLPPEAARAGRNRVRVDVWPLPGLPTCCGAEVDRVELVVRR